MLDARDLPHGQVLQADICIVGAGAVGIAMALALSNTKLNVLLLESGGMKPDDQTQDLYSGLVADAKLHSPPDRYRQRCFGGSTTIWGGRCVPFDGIDFEKRSYVPYSGWPFGREAVEPYYAMANELCEAGRFAYDAGAALAASQRPMIRGFESSWFSQDRLERFSVPTNFGIRYAQALSDAGNVCVLLHANLTELVLSRDCTTVVSASVCTLNGIALSVRAAHYVLASGGLETARLLLANRKVQPRGIGNDYDQVGRYYMCHIAGTAGTLRLHRPEAVWHGYDLSPDGVYCRRRLALTEAAQRHWRVGNFITRLHHPRITDPSHRTGILSLLYLAKPFIPYEYGKRLHGDEPADFVHTMRHAGNVLCDPLDIAAFLLHWMRYRTLSRRKFPSVVIHPRTPCYSLDFHAEQYPNPSSRITLDERRTDALGMPRIVVDWRYTPADVETVARALQLLRGEINRCGVGSLHYDPRTVEEEITRYGAYGGHHIGTARMGTDPRQSVVDPNCRVHGVANLFVSGAAVFPTSSQANPTLTVVALALRLADHLKRISASKTVYLNTAPVARDELVGGDREVASAA